MRTLRWIKQNTDVLTLLILAIGLIFALDQARKLKESIDATNWNSVASQWLDMDEKFVDRSELRKYIYDGADIPSDENDKQKALAIGNYVLDFLDNALIIGHNIGNSDITHISEWTEYFDKLILAHNPPAICAIFNGAPEGYSKYTNELVGPHCAKH
jgi:hypothetical protein